MSDCGAYVTAHSRYKELGLKSLYLGLSDGARTNELRRASGGEIGNEQIWHAYELGNEKIDDMKTALADSLKKADLPSDNARFSLIWLLDDFSGSGNTYIRPADQGSGFKGKIKKIYEVLERGGIADPNYYAVSLVLYVATRQAIDHIEYWSERFTSENGLPPLKLEVVHILEKQASVLSEPSLQTILNHQDYVDSRAADKHFLVGGNPDPRLGFAKCALPLSLVHNTPNNSIYVLWGPENLSFKGLFPRVSRHREF